MYTNKWPTKKLGEVLHYEQPTAYLVESTEYNDEYETPVLTAGKSFIKGYTNETDGIFSADKLPVIIFDDFTTATQFVDFQFKVKSTAMKILVPSDELDISYAYYFMQTIDHDHRTHKRYWISEYSKREILLPPLEEQKRIVKVLEEKLGKIKEAIQLRKDAIVDAEKILSAKLSEIFTEGKEKGWEERRIDEVAIINPKKSEVSLVADETRVAFVPMSAVSDNQQKIVASEIRSLGGVRKGYTYFKRNDLLFAKITPCMENGKVAVADIETEIGFGTTEFHVLRSIEAESNIRFLYYILASKKFRLEAEKKMTGSAGQKRVPKDFIENYRITIPDLKIQEQIVKELDELSERLAELRTLQDEQLTNLKSLERAYLLEAFNGNL